MIDAGYNYDRLAEKMGWLDLDPAKIHHIEAGMSHGSKMALSRFLSFILSNSVLIRLEQISSSTEFQNMTINAPKGREYRTTLAKRLP